MMLAAMFYNPLNINLRKVMLRESERNDGNFHLKCLSVIFLINISGEDFVTNCVKAFFMSNKLAESINIT